MDFFAEIKAYVGFTAADSEILGEFLPVARPHFAATAEHFYERILNHDGAHRAITGGQAQIDRLKRTLAEWMESGLAGPHDDAFLQRRQRIGRVHVDIQLPQRYMLTAMNVMRLDFRRITEEHWREPRDRFERINDALDRLFDLELAIMLETYKEDSELRLRQREKLATIGQIAASIGHDLRNPLSVMESSLYILKRRVTADERALAHAEKIQGQIDACDRIITALLEMARDNKSVKRAEHSVGDLVKTAIEHANVRSTTRIHVEYPQELLILVDDTLLHLALVNLIINAEQAQPAVAAQIWVRARTEGTDVIIEVEDGGPGFDLAILPRVFEPLTTTKSAGTGLGLALVKSVVERHRGIVVGMNASHGGALVRIHLPESVP